MRLSGKNRAPQVRLVASTLLFGLVLAGCGQSASSAGEAAVAAGSAYELVQLERPEPPDGPFQVVKETAYKLCATIAELQHIPVKPFPKTPADYATQRITVVTDGKSFMRKTEALYSADTSTITPERGCEYRITPSKAYNVTLVHDGKQTDINVGEDGKTTVDTTGAGSFAAASSASGETSQFSERRTVNGVNLRCWPKSHPMLADGSLLEMCVYEKDGVLTEVDQQAITLYSKARPAGNDPRFQYVVIMEPVSVRKLTEGISKRFKAESYTQ
jgi:hypothetical protein